MGGGGGGGGGETRVGQGQIQDFWKGGSYV